MSSRRAFVTRWRGCSCAAFFKETALRQAIRAGTRWPLDHATPPRTYWGKSTRLDARPFDDNLIMVSYPPQPPSFSRQYSRSASARLPFPHVRVGAADRASARLATRLRLHPRGSCITRNASEALETLIFGMDLSPGDEVLVTNQNYGRMLTSWDQRVRRDGVVLRQLSFPVPPPSQDYLVELFRKAITPRTKLIEITHITNLRQFFRCIKFLAMAKPCICRCSLTGATLTRTSRSLLTNLTPTITAFAPRVVAAPIVTGSSMSSGKSVEWAIDGRPRQDADIRSSRRSVPSCCHHMHSARCLPPCDRAERRSRVALPARILALPTLRKRSLHFPRQSHRHAERCLVTVGHRHP